jgi:hypothetical protein
MEFFQEKEFACKCCRKLPPFEKENIEALVRNLLDPVRKEFGRPIKVNSGYRCSNRNAAVGGAKNSQHLRGEAADIAAESRGYANMAAWKEGNQDIARLIIKRGRFDQLILEGVGENDLLPTWIHVSYSRKCCRGQVLKKVAGQVGYQALTTEEIASLIGPNFKAKN